MSEILIPSILGGSHAGPGALPGCGLVTSSCEQQHLCAPGSDAQGITFSVHQEEEKVGEHGFSWWLQSRVRHWEAD